MGLFGSLESSFAVRALCVACVTAFLFIIAPANNYLYASGEEKGIRKGEKSGLSSRNSRGRVEVESAKKKKLGVATFGGGCFWCMEPPYEKQEGVEAVVSGYMGDNGQPAPSYGTVSSGKTKYLEVVQVFYDRKKIKYDQLLDIFWQNIDPTQADGQFVDKGPQYLTAIFFHNSEQRRLAERSKKKITKDPRLQGKKVVTAIRSATEFYPAEDYHQDYYKTNSRHYKLYRRGSGRDSFIEKTWKKEP